MNHESESNTQIKYMVLESLWLFLLEEHVIGEIYQTTFWGHLTVKENDDKKLIEHFRWDATHAHFTRIAGFLNNDFSVWIERWCGVISLITSIGGGTGEAAWA